jgi:hypothetical protein
MIERLNLVIWGSDDWAIEFGDGEIWRSGDLAIGGSGDPMSWRAI